MIRINLLGQKPPKKQSAAAPAGTTVTLVLLLGSLLVAGGVLYVIWNDKVKSVEKTQGEVNVLNQQIAALQGVKANVEKLKEKKLLLDRQYAVLDQLSQNRSGGEELMESLAGSVVRSDAVWLTAMDKKGNILTLDGTAGSINAVANFITEMKRSGHFGKVEISESRQDERNPAVATFLFKLTAEFLPTQSKPAAPAAS